MLVWHCTSKLNVVISVKVNNARYGVGNRESDGECICKTVKNKSKNCEICCGKRLSKSQQTGSRTILLSLKTICFIQHKSESE